MFKEIFWTWIPWIFNRVSATVDLGKNLVRIVYNELTQTKELVFLINSDIPVSTQLFGQIVDSCVKWRCSVNPCAFVKPGLQNTKEKHLSYLGFIIKIPAFDTNQAQDIDISDWINELKWKGSIEPTLKEIFLLWSFSSGESFFHCLNEIQVEYITDMGDTIRKGLMDPL